MAAMVFIIKYLSIYLIYADLLKQKKAFTKRKKFNSHMHRIALEYQHGHRFMFLNTTWDL